MSSADRTGRSARIESTVTPVAGTAGCRAAVVLGQPLRVFFHAGNPQNRDNHDAGVSPIMAENFTSGDRRRPGTGNLITLGGSETERKKGKKVPAPEDHGSCKIEDSLLICINGLA